MSVDGTPVGQLMAAKDTINVVTDAPLGYKLMISASSSSLNQASGSAKFNAVSGTLSSPVTLGTDTWGFSLSEQNLPIPSASSTWAGVSTTPTQIDSYDYATDESGRDLDIYYGINATTNLPTDTYSTVVTYTAMAEGITEEAPLMQNYTYAECAALSTGSSTTLMDKRNGANYRVTKLADGNCWMTQNLRLDGGITLSYTDTNLPYGNSDVELPENIEEGDESFDTAMQIIRNLPGYDGNLYNWCAATLNNTNCSTTTAEATQDICPKGWRLPSNSGNPSYANLFSVGGVTNYTGAEASPYYFTMDGYYSGHYGFLGLNGIYWTNTPISELRANRFYYEKDRFIPQDDREKRRGSSLRCVFQGNDFTRLTYMQDMTTALCQNTPEHASKNLIDNRDNKSYRVTKLKDGKCWMTSNLKLENYTLKQANSDVTSDVIIPTAQTTGSTGQWLIQVWKNDGYDGYLYNFCAAVANANCKNETVNAEQPYSICPKGWRLPSITGNTSFSNLFGQYNLPTSNVSANYIAGAEASPLNFSRAGYYYGSTYANQGVSGAYWSNYHGGSAVDAHDFYYSDSLFRPINVDDIAIGFSIRCLAR